MRAFVLGNFASSIRMVNRSVSRPKKKHWRIAARRNLDLVLVAPNARPPVAKIMDYGKYRFRTAKERKRNA